MGLFAYSLAFLIAGPFLTGAEDWDCAHGWMMYQRHCYGLVTESQTWAEAELHCQSYGPRCHLASIFTREESAKAAKLIRGHPGKIGHVWIGLRDIRRRQWRWTDGGSFYYKAWNTGEPNNLGNNEHCAELWSDAEHLLWNDENCRAERASLCKCRL